MFDSKAISPVKIEPKSAWKTFQTNVVQTAPRIKKNEPPLADIGRLIQKAKVPRLPLGGSEERAEHQMKDVTNEMPEAIQRQARRILHDIENAGSMIAAVKSGAKANGFVLGIMCSRGLPEEQCDLLAQHFDTVTEMKLRRLALGF